MSKEIIKEGDTITVNVKLKSKEIWISEVVLHEGELILKSNEVYLESIPDRWITNINPIK